MKAIAQIIFKITGWQVSYTDVPELKKCVMIAAPHTSNWDFFYARLAFFIMGVKVRYMIKKELIRFPFGWIFKALGAIPVDRKKKGNLVDACIHLFNENKELVVLIPPEGTRGIVEKWKTGFYHTAVGAKVPIALGYLDFKKKVAGIGPVFWPTGDIQKDFDHLRNFYKDISPAHPEFFDPSTIKP
jgi:1-acyl-sn-glycerol-3-phosphate acyltransferase